MKEKVKFLGHFVVEAGIEPDKMKIEMIKIRPMPNAVKEIQGLIGLVSYYRTHCGRFAQVANTNTRFTFKNAKLIWSEKC